MKFALAWFAFVLFILVGWVNNLIAVIDSADAMITVAMVVRIAGIFVMPLGVIVGYL